MLLTSPPGPPSAAPPCPPLRWSTGIAPLRFPLSLISPQALKFDLIVHSPYKAVEGFFEDIKEAALAAGRLAVAQLVWVHANDAAPSAGRGSSSVRRTKAARHSCSCPLPSSSARASLSPLVSGSSEAAAAAEGLDAGMSTLAPEQLERVRAAAYAAADALMLSDAPLLHAPGRLALAALRSGFNKVRSAGGAGRAVEAG